MIIKSDEPEHFLNSNNIIDLSGNTLLTHALHYSKLGYPVLPLHSLSVTDKNSCPICTCRNESRCEAIGKHPRTRFGLKEATTDEDQIIDWWTKHPDSNIGILTGKESGIFVLDIDVNTGGEYSLDDLTYYYKYLFREKFDFEKTLIAQTGSGGRHLYLKHPLDFDIDNSASLIAPGLDVKGDNGYIVAPPSLHKTGRNYNWLGVNTPILDAPKWLIAEIITSNESFDKAAFKEDLSTANYGNVAGRNDYIFRRVRGLINTYSEEETLKRALEHNDLFNVPLEKNEVAYIVKKTIRLYGKQKDMGLKS